MFNAACVSGGRPNPNLPVDPSDPDVDQTDTTKDDTTDPTDPEETDDGEGDGTADDGKTDELVTDVAIEEDGESISIWIVLAIIAVALCIIGFISFKLYRRRRTEFKVKTSQIQNHGAPGPVGPRGAEKSKRRPGQKEKEMEKGQPLPGKVLSKKKKNLAKLQKPDGTRPLGAANPQDRL